MISDSIKNGKVKINIDAAHGKASKVVIVGDDTVADINIMKGDTNSLPGLVINGPKIDGEFFHKSHLDLIAVVVPLSFFAAAAIITWLLLRFAQRRNEMRHQERMAAIEQGVVMPTDTQVVITPADPGAPVQIKYARPYNPYKWPLILGLAGLALVIANFLEGDKDFGFGLVLLAIGAALFLSHYLRRKDLQQHAEWHPPTTTHTPPVPPIPPTPPTSPQL